MAFNGSGTFVRLYNWVNDAAASINITASRMDGETDGIASGLSLCLTRDGQGVPSANLPMANFKHTGAAIATAANQYLTYGQAGNFTSLTMAGALTGVTDITASGVVNATGGGSTKGVRIGGATVQSSFTDDGGGNVFLDIGAGGSAASVPFVLRTKGTGGSMQFQPNGVLGMQISGAGLITDGAGLELGFKGCPGASVTTGAFVAADNGKIVYATAGVTVPNSVMATGNSVKIFNNTGGSITITATITTLYFAGTALTGNRTLATRGLCVVDFLSSTAAVISGTGLT